MSRASRWSALGLGLAVVLLAAGPAHAQAPLTARIFFPAGPAESGLFTTSQPIPLVLQIENTSGAPVATTQGFSVTEFFRRLYFVDPRGGIVTNKFEERVHDVSRVFMCLTRAGILLTQAIPVVPVEILAGPSSPQGPFVVEFTIPDLRSFYDLSRPGTYTVDARLALLVFALTNAAAVFDDCDQVPGQVANVGAVSGREDFTIVSNTLAFTVEGDPPLPPATTATVSPSPGASGWLRQPAVVSFTATSPSQVPIQRIVVQSSGAEAGETNLTGAQGAITVATDGVTSVGYHAEDSGGNIEPAQELAVSIDRAAPLIAVTVPAPNATYTQGQVVAAAYACTDAASGVATCAGTVASGTPIDTTTLGPKTFTIDASDVAGNAATPVSIAYTVGTGIGPDLVVTSVSTPLASAQPGGRLSVTETVRNQGNAVAAASTTGYYVSLDTLKDPGDTRLPETRAVPSRNPGASSTATKTLTIPLTIPFGTYHVLVCADDRAIVTELDEDNNCRASATTVLLGRPDLVTTAVSNPPAVVPPGGAFDVTDTVVNQGTVPSGTSTMRYYMSLVAQKTNESKRLGGTRAVPSLAPGAPSVGTKTVTVPGTIALGSYFLLACADDASRLVETSETNNCLVAATQVTVGRPELVVTVVSNPPPLAARGSSFAVTDTVKNLGALEAGPSTTRYSLSLDPLPGRDRLLAATRAVPTLAPNAEFPAPAPLILTIPTTTPSGTYYLLACADAQRRVKEASETNNCLASSTTVVVP